MPRNRADRGDLEAIWSHLSAKIDQNAAILERRGTIKTRIAGGKERFVIRFHELLDDGRRIERSIYLGSNPEIVRRAKVLLEIIKLVGRYEKEAKLFANLAATISYRAKQAARRLSREV